MDLLASVVEAMVEPLASWGQGQARGEGAAGSDGLDGEEGGFWHFVRVYVRGQLALAQHCLQQLQQLRDRLEAQQNGTSQAK